MTRSVNVHHTVWDSRQIQEMLPQRYPFIMIDRVIKADRRKGKVVCVKNVTGNEGHFLGHFPDNPIMPGALILEAMGQAGILLYWLLRPEQAAKRPLYLMGTIKATFKRTVVPGDQLIIEVTKDKLLDNVGRILARAEVNGCLVMESTMSFGVIKKNG